MTVKWKIPGRGNCIFHTSTNNNKSKKKGKYKNITKDKFATKSQKPGKLIQLKSAFDENVSSYHGKAFIKVENIFVIKK